MRESATEFTSPLELLGEVGRRFAPTDWRTVDQRTIDTFGRLTDDTQWVHCDLNRAAAGPFGTTIAHGYFTLALCSVFLREAMSVDGADMALNYGLDRVRFPSPVRVGASLRGVASISRAEIVADGAAVQIAIRMTIEVKGAEKPACVADVLVRYAANGGNASTAAS